MNNKIKGLLSYFVIALISISSIQCDNDYPDSIFDPNAVFKPDPVITSIYPDSVYAAVDTIEITGQNFSSVDGENVVFFNGVAGYIMMNTPTMINISVLVFLLFQQVEQLQIFKQRAE